MGFGISVLSGSTWGMNEGVADGGSWLSSHTELAMLRRRYPVRKFIPPPQKRLCTLKPRPEFDSKINQIRSDVCQILSEEKDLAKRKRPHPWSDHPKPSTKSILTKGFEEFEYVLRPLVRPSLAFGSKLPRDPTEREIKRHKLKLKKKRYYSYAKPYDETTKSRTIQGTSRPSKAKSSISRPSSTAAANQGSIIPEGEHGEEELVEISEAVKEDKEREGEEQVLHEPEEYEEYSSEDLPRKPTLTKWSWNGSLNSSLTSSIENLNNDPPTVSNIRLSKKKAQKKQDASLSPVSYHIRRFPDRVKRNKRPFNSTAIQQTETKTEVPSAAAYRVDIGDEIKGVKLDSSLGGWQTIKLPTVIRCLPANRNLCKRCQKEPKGDFYYSKYQGSLCRECFPIETQSCPAHIVSSYQKARHCALMHYHAQHNTVRTRRYKDVIRFLRREAYINQFPEMKKNVKVVEKTQADWLAKCRDLHRSKHQELKRIIRNPKICAKSCKTEESDEGEDESQRDRQEQASQGQIDNRVSVEREFEEMAKEYEYQQMNTRHSIVPIYNLLYKDDLVSSIGEDHSQEKKTDFQLKLLKRFGSTASYYGTLIPEFREKGVVHAVDPDSDEYLLTAKGREYYKKTPLAWELSQDQMTEAEETLRIAGENEIEEMMKLKKITKTKQRDIVTPPLPGPRLSTIITEDSFKAPKHHLSKIHLEKPIVSRDYDIPKSYWYNIDR